MTPDLGLVTVTGNLTFSGAATFTLVIVQAIWVWNELLIALVFLQSESSRTLMAGLTQFQGRFVTNQPLVLSGALIAFELARELARRNEPGPLRLFASARRAPHLPRSRRLIHHLPSGEFIRELRSYNCTPSAVLA